MLIRVSALLGLTAFYLIYLGKAKKVSVLCFPFPMLAVILVAFFEDNGFIGKFGWSCVIMSECGFCN